MSAQSHRIPPQTTGQAKAAYKKKSHCLPESELRRLKRGAELQCRAKKIHQLEIQREATKRRKADRDERERQARLQRGIGLATQLAGCSRAKAQMKSRMEAYLGFDRNRGKGSSSLRIHQNQASHLAHHEGPSKLASAYNANIAGASGSSIVMSGITDPRDDFDGSSEINDFQYFEDVEDCKEFDDLGGLDDGTLLEAHDQAMSDLNAHPERPMDQALDTMLKSLSGPLVELLSEDYSKVPTWRPTPSLLHSLTPAGLPCHRLLIKVGCNATLLSPIDAEWPVPSSTQLQIVRVEKEKLECLILHGKLEGTRTFVSRSCFTGRYNGDARFTFRRRQFPIRIAACSVEDASDRSDTRPPKSLAICDGTKRFVRYDDSLHSSPFNDAVAANDHTDWGRFLTTGTQIARELSEKNTMDSGSEPQASSTSLPAQKLGTPAEDLGDNSLLASKTSPFSHRSHQIRAGRGSDFPHSQAFESRRPSPFGSAHSMSSTGQVLSSNRKANEARRIRTQDSLATWSGTAQVEFGISAQDLAAFVDNSSSLFSD